MPVRDNPLLGYTVCSECEELATVHQQSRGAGRYLYTRGCDCKYRNSTGAKFQTRLWLETDWLNDIEPTKPPNILDDVQAHEPNDEYDGENLENSTNGKYAKNWVAAGFTILAGLVLIAVTGGRRLP